MRTLLFLAAIATQAGTPTEVAREAESRSVTSTYVPERVYDTRAKDFSDFEVMLADLSRADVVLVGEQHDDPNTHRLERAILEGLLRRKIAVRLSLEMFERDTQALLDSYLASKVSEEEFLKGSRPWPRYATDYRPLIELAKIHGWRVVASNVPRRHASAVAKSGLSAIDALSDERRFVARDLQCPKDDYFDRFSETMNSHPAPGTEKLSAGERAATSERYYLAQCVKDETMAESIVEAFERHAGQPGTIVHVNGAFHSDFGSGVAERVRRRLPGRRVAIVSILPVTDIDTVTPKDEDLRRAEYLVYTVTP